MLRIPNFMTFSGYSYCRFYFDVTAKSDRTFRRKHLKLSETKTGKPNVRFELKALLFLVWEISLDYPLDGRSQWPRGLRRRSSAARLLKLWVRFPPGAWMFVCCECCVLSGRGLCDGLITRPRESYRLWRVFVCDQETSKTWRLKPATGL